ncbi:hypothetical protein ACO0KY_14045 [Undibacterium sp. Dicai25W]|uniref:hypothetical protein n=1 Tax=Undibacterium sp. Dicai25W TaxID=3413034 RepID=UPI003BF029A3
MSAVLTYSGFVLQHPTPSNSITATDNNGGDAIDHVEETPEAETQAIREPRLWRDKGWTARVIKNDDDEGWAVAMLKDGEPEPALVGPWTMGRDKKNPKPLDTNAFNTLVKTASEVIRRHEQQMHAQLNKSMMLSTDEADYKVILNIVPDEDDPYAYLSAEDAAGNLLAKVKVTPHYKLNRQNALKWIENDFRRPE